MRSTDLYTFLDTNGDGTGTKNAIGDYSGGQNFYFTCPETATSVDIYRMIVYVEDSGNFSSAGYGNLSALTNGIQIRQEKEGETIDMTNSQEVKTNAEWSKFCYDVTYISFGSGNNALSIRWTFRNSGSPVKLDPGEKFIVYLEDNLTGLVQHTFQIQGQYNW